MSASPETRIISRDLTVFRHHRLAAIVDILAQRCQDEPDCETPLPAEYCACGKYRLIPGAAPEDKGA